MVQGIVSTERANSQPSDVSPVQRSLHVLAAIREFDAIGRDTFLERYSFRRARQYFLIHRGKMYDSKAILGAAHGYQHGEPLHWKSFNGGHQTTEALERMGFEVT